MVTPDPRASRPSLVLAALLVSALAAGQSATPGKSPPAPSPDEVAEALEDILSDDAFQRELPAIELDRDQQPARSGTPEGMPIFMVDARPVRFVAYGGAAVALLLGALWLVRRLSEGDEHGRAELITGASAPLDARPLLDADGVAREGRFAEAIRLLLLRTFESLSRTVDFRLAPGMTSREVLVRLPLPGTARPALADLVDAVESSAFAGRPVSEADYRRCAERFTVLQRTFTGAPG